MSQSSTITARCAALSISIAQVIPDISQFARKVRDARHDLNAINHDLLILRTGLGVAQDDFATSGPKLPLALADAVVQIIDSCDATSERLHKAFLRLSCSTQPKDDWHTLKHGALASMRQDLEGSRIVLELSLDYLALYGQQDTIDSFLQHYVSDLITASDDLLKRTDAEEIQINQLARERLSSLLQAIRLLRSCITAISREGKRNVMTSERRTTTPRPDSLEPTLGESRRSGRVSPPSNVATPTSASKGISTWLADIPHHGDAQPLRHSRIIQMSEPKQNSKRISKRTSREEMTPSRGTFYTDDGVSTSRTLVQPESRLKKTKSWCSGVTAQYATHNSCMTKVSSKYTPTIASSEVSIFNKHLTCDKIAVSKGNRKNLDIDSRVAVDRILANVPAEATAADVEHILWEGANPMVVHPEFGFFFIRAAYDMSHAVLEMLVEFGADIKKPLPSPNRYHCVMHAAALGGQVDTIKYLVSLGHSIDTTNATGETPLILAVKTPGAYGAAKYLLDVGADVNHESDEGETPLYLALTSKVLEGRERSRMIELLLAHGAEGDGKDNMDGKTSRGDAKGRSILGIT
ncbi:hypothetical protein CC86DRAFT_444206 [Ophiobolus disseminans]|uniref:Uncharacterized protein n=1 Tax=Ophiobolus disseminans TaxID=1469910 RepID=A0A6A7A6L0_9PLEO|nr:hypothetical protein CC86DRAFT_444206 [Ophiobolus disseminans]